MRITFLIVPTHLSVFFGVTCVIGAISCANCFSVVSPRCDVLGHVFLWVFSVSLSGIFPLLSPQTFRVAGFLCMISCFSSGSIFRDSVVAPCTHQPVAETLDGPHVFTSDASPFRLLNKRKKVKLFASQGVNLYRQVSFWLDPLGVSASFGSFCTR